LLHYFGVEAFGILCDRLDPEDPYNLSYGTLLSKLHLYAGTARDCKDLHISRKNATARRKRSKIYGSIAKIIALLQVLRPNPEDFVYISWKEREGGGMEERIQ